MTDPSSVAPPATDLVYALAASPDFAHDGILFAARASGLYRSDDAGASWRFLYASLKPTEPLATLAVALAPDFPSTPTVLAGVTGGVLRSADGGQAWRIAQPSTPAPTVSSLCLSPAFAQDGVVLAGSMQDGFFRSADRGARWNAWNFGLLDLSVLALAASPDFANDETAVLGAETGLFRSTNGGRAWRDVALPGGFVAVPGLALSPNYAQDRTLFVATESSGLLRSADDAESWTRLGQDELGDAINAVLLAPDYPHRPHVLALTADAAWISRDDGRSWGPWETGLEAGQAIMCAAAPLGLEPGAPLWVGLGDGRVVRLG